MEIKLSPEYIASVTDMETLNDMEKIAQLERGRLNKIENMIRRRKKELDLLKK